MESFNPSRVDLRNVRDILRHYCQALTATEVQIRSTEELSRRGIGWTSVEEPTTEGTTIFLPPLVQESESVRGNFETYKVFATHQAGHLEFGTFWFSLHRAATRFKDFRPTLLEINGGADGAVTDFERFFDLFLDRRLVVDIFTVVEDERVDFLLKREYNGIRPVYRRAQDKSLSKRPVVMSLPLREALLEILVQISIGGKGSVLVPRPLASRVKLASGVLRRIQTPSSTVEDAAEATIRLYCLFQEVPNVAAASVPPELWGSFSLDDNQEIDDAELDEMLYFFFSNGGEVKRAAGESPYRRPKNVDFRGELKPELAQTLLKLGLHEGGDDKEDPGPEISPEGLKQLFGKSVEIDEKDRADVSPAAFARNLIKERGRAYLSGELSKRNQPAHASKARRGIVKGSGFTADFLYDEWDFLANHYKQEWCRLRQRVLEEGSDSFFAETLRQYAGLVAGVKKEFEHLRTERFKKIKRLQDGDDLDFDAVVDSLVEKKVGAPFSDQVYWRREKLERDVCVAFLLDMSASTYEKITGNDVWAAAASHDGLWSGKRIIDLEKEAIIVLVEALESIGDTYGIYGFSGHGRDNVEFAIIKNMSEDCSSVVKRRIASINPIQGTRMGPALRHLAAILDGQEAKTKLLILISDGRPQDHDYGGHHSGEEWGIYNHMPNRRMFFMDEATERMKKEYAIYDTRMALLEARQRGITPFCLTIDKTGHDYLKTMCGEVGYEVLDNIYALPRRLPSLYRRLTAHV